VYASRGTDVRVTMVDGDVLVNDFRPVRWDSREISASARHEARALAARARL
jgi:5-methylthioadenosine/S-adenosylhomocysteine deaminase